MIQASFAPLKNLRNPALRRPGVYLPASTPVQPVKIDSRANLAALWRDLGDLLAGGPGSGCHGDNCGRPPGPHALPEGFGKQSSQVFEHHGWNKAKKEILESYPNGKPLVTQTTYKHPAYGAITVWHKDHGGTTFTHTDKNGTVVKQATDIGKFSKNVHEHLTQLKQDDGPKFTKGWQEEDKGTIPTGPVLPYQAPKPATPPPVAGNNEFKFAGNASALGGAHEKYKFTDSQGNGWLFKPATTIGGAASPMMAHADEVVSKIAQILRPGAAVEAKVTTVAIPGKGQVFGSIQKMVPADQLLWQKDFTGISPANLNSKDIKGLQQEQVVDWLISNHDAHSGQFLRGTNAEVVGIDKSQAFKFLGKDTLSMSYHPNTMEKAPYYNEMWKAVDAGKIGFDPMDALPVIKRAEAIPTAEYRQMLTPYAEARHPENPVAQAQFLDQAVARKDSLRSDFEKFYSNILNEKFTFGSKPESSKLSDKLGDLEKKMSYSPKPDVAGKQPVSQEMHEKLEDLGYKFSKYGAQSGKPLYTDPSGKAVYVDDKKFEYYPMGTHGQNPYGSTKGEGAAALQKALSVPFEKPSTPTPTPSSTSKTSQNSSPIAVWETTTGKSLEDVPFQPVSNQTKLPTGQTIGGEPGDYYVKLGAITPSEKATIKSYKGYDYHSINGFLYNSKPGQETMDSKVEHLDSALKKAKTDRDLVVFRGVSKDYTNNLIKDKQLEVGNTFPALSFQSVSTKQSFSHSWGDGHVFRINLPKGTNVIAPYNGGPDFEYEYVLDRKTQYKVNKVYQSGDRMYVDVDVV